MAPKCIVFGCQKNKINKQHLFNFPEDVEKRTMWLWLIGREDINAVDVKKNWKVCSQHFPEDAYFVFSTKAVLKPNRAPQAINNRENIPPVSVAEVPTTKRKQMECSETEDVAVLKSKIAKLENTIRALKKKKTPLRKSTTTKRSTFLIHNFMSSDSKILYYTGIQSYVIFKLLFEFLLPSGNSSELLLNQCIKNRNQNRPRKLSAMNQFFMTLMKLRRGFDYQTLADMFLVSESVVARTFVAWINFMYIKLASFVIWPHRNVILQNCSEDFKEKHINVIGSIDCTEFYIETPSSLVRQSQCYSNYKSSNTIKSLIMIDPNGAIIFISALFTGSISDKRIVKDSGFLHVIKKMMEMGYLEEGDVILADKGFNITDLLSDTKIELNIPTFKITGMQFHPNDVQQIRTIAKERIHVERAIRRLKSFKILSHKIPIAMLGTINQIYTVCCLLTNLRFPLIK